MSRKADEENGRGENLVQVRKADEVKEMGRGWIIRQMM
jgi:hypothetical protein